MTSRLYGARRGQPRRGGPVCASVLDMLSSREDWIWDSWIADDGERYHLFFLKAPRALERSAACAMRRRGSATRAPRPRRVGLHEDALGPAAEGFDDLALWTGSVARGDDGVWRMYYTALNSRGSRRARPADRDRGVRRPDDVAAGRRASRWSTPDPRWYRMLGDGSGASETWRDPFVFRDGGRLAHADHGPRAGRARLRDGVLAHARSDDMVDWRLAPPLTEPAQLRPARGRRRSARSTGSGCSSSPATRRSRPSRGRLQHLVRPRRLAARAVGRRVGAAVRGPSRSCSRRRSSSAATGHGRSWASSIRSRRESSPSTSSIRSRWSSREEHCDGPARQREGCRGLRTRRCSRGRGHTARCDSEERQLRTPAGARAVDVRVAGAADRGAVDGLLDRRGDRGRDRLAPTRGHPADPRPGRQPAAVLPAAARLDARVRRRARRRRARCRWSSRCWRSRRRSGRGRGSSTGARAFVAAAGAAGAPFLTYYAQETRMYSLVVLLSILASASFALAFVRGERRHVAWLGLWLALLLYTHTWGLFLAAAMAVAWLVLWRRGQVGGRRRRAAGGRAGAALRAVAAERALAGRAHRGAVGGAAVAAAAARLPGRAVRLPRAAAAGRRGVLRAAPAPAGRSRGARAGRRWRS